MNFNVQLDDAATEKVKASAAARGMPLEQLIATAAKWFVAEQDGYEADWSEQDATDFVEAKAQFARGQGVPHEEVMASGRARLRAR